MNSADGFDETLVVEQVGKQSNRSVVVADGGHERDHPVVLKEGRKVFRSVKLSLKEQCGPSSLWPDLIGR
jgi:hypothetical protein